MRPTRCASCTKCGTFLITDQETPMCGMCELAFKPTSAPPPTVEYRKLPPDPFPLVGLMIGIAMVLMVFLASRGC